MDQQEVSVWVGSQLVSQKGQLQTKEILLVLLLLDDSSSIEESGNTQAVIDGYNLFLEALKNAPGIVRVRTMFLNHNWDISFQKPSEMQLLSHQIYRPVGSTPLFARSKLAFDCITNEAQKLLLQGFNVRTMSFIFTDGGDNDSGTIIASNVKLIIDSMLATNTNIVGGCAVNDGSTNFWKVFTSMGIPEQWIKVLKNEPEKVRESMSQMGDIASYASTSFQDFTQTSETGFGPTKEDDKK